MLILLMFFVLTRADAQNEFAATAFYNEFKKIVEDAQNGFANAKGEKRKSEYPELSVEYKTKLMLPLADSGKLVIPNNGYPYVVYYFEPDKVRLKIDQRGVNLREAVVTAFNKPLYARTETILINNYPLTNTLYFLKPGESRSGAAVFRQSIYFHNGRYYLSFEIRGKKE